MINMKQLLSLNKKWILTASLLAVLGTQYSYQSSSLDFKSASSPNRNYGEFVLASITSPDASEVKTEASGTECKDGCETYVLPSSTIKIVKTDLPELLRLLKIESKIEPVAAVVAAEIDSDCEPASADETREEKRVRKQCEKEEKAQAKLDKENDKKQIRIEKFEDKMEALKDKCDDDIECLSSGFTTALSRYTRKDALPAATVYKAFNSVVGVPLKKALASNDPAVLVSAQSLLQDMPEKYKALKEVVILAVKSQLTLSANKVSTEYAAVNELSKQNKPQEYFEALNTAQQDHQALNNLVIGYTVSMEQSLELASDTSTIAFYQKSYVPDMKKIMAAVTSGAQTIDTKNNTRADRAATTTSNNSTSTALPANEKMTRNNNTEWVSPASQGFESGSVTNQSRGGRTSQP